MSHPRFLKIPAGMTFEEFKKEYWRLFKFSNLKEREAAMKSEYERLTGNKPAEKPEEKKHKRAKKEEPKDGAAEVYPSQI